MDITRASFASPFFNKKISRKAVEFVGNARALSKDLWATLRVVHQDRQNPQLWRLVDMWATLRVVQALW